MNALDRLKQEFIDEIKCGRLEEAARILAERDALLLHGLATGKDIAQLLGVTQSAVSNWKERYDDFPAPLVGEGRTARYSRAEVLAWWAGRHPALVNAIRDLED